MGRRGYPAEFRRKVLDLVRAGHSVADVAHDLGIGTETICAWRSPCPRCPPPCDRVGTSGTGRFIADTGADHREHS
ncbi:transposase [Nocardiopsis sp. CC223A]|uniref:transposase n=1 Tax=Nocardiopsis sp. CC223A TaxID=3044051 RepID=UPI002795DDDC|nr:transposase [Nocardiopsis sp. CC223A]